METPTDPLNREPSREPWLTPLRAAWLAALVVFATCAWFINTRPGWNVLSQFALTCAIVEDGILSIDRYHEATNDKAVYGGRFYSDKSPVTAFLGVPALWIYRTVIDSGAATGGTVFDDPLARYTTTLFSVGLCAAWLAGMLAWAFARRGVNPGVAAAGGALFVAATPLLGYSILFFNYAPACALALAGYLLALSAAETGAVRRMFFAGLLLGLAAWTLNTLAIAALVISVAAGWEWIARRRWGLCAAWVAGGICGAAGYFIYIYSIFGSFSSPYAFEYDAFFREQMAQGLMGATWPPRPMVAWLVTFDPFLGLFSCFPLALVAALGCVAAVIGKAVRREGGVGLGVFVLLLLYTSAYFMWWGGWAYAPRHLIPALPFLALGLPALLRRRGSIIFVIVIGIIGAVLNLGVVALDPQPPPGFPRPVAQELLMTQTASDVWSSAFWSLQRVFWLGDQVDMNWGVKLGLTGKASLLPLTGLWIGFFALLGAAGRRRA